MSLLCNTSIKIYDFSSLDIFLLLFLPLSKMSDTIFISPRHLLLQTSILASMASNCDVHAMFIKKCGIESLHT